ncbi:MAG: cbb3-type cytochrome c oxidase N-terminal domain-containing protein [Cytophaga sp.]|uniref:cbb3-type cytochrome c oxidase N-terminal domain-containing protein n=1 Tax=Cytophaga sp. TaxID=29535 RepID=UPI003F801464
MKKSVFFVVSFLLMIHSAFATSIAAEVPAPSVSDSSSVILIFVLSTLIVLLLAFIYFLYYMSIAMQVMYANGKEAKPLFDFTDAVPIEREHEIMLDHNYDGIIELDNNLPTWWLYLFYATVVFAVVYFSYFTVMKYGDNQTQEYEQEILAAAEEMKLHASKVDENSATMLTDAAALKEGKILFDENCAACHGKLGEGGVGPNFTDAYWLHGGDIKSVFKTIKYGVPEKGMIAWQTQISPVQIQQAASYILSLKGTNPPNAKAPQGELVK